jgi:hypothetical protein
MVSAKSVMGVYIEAVIVGILILPVYYTLSYFFKDYIKSEMTMIFMTGLYFHLICEYTGINMWYAKEYCKLLV